MTPVTVHYLPAGLSGLARRQLLPTGRGYIPGQT